VWYLGFASRSAGVSKHGNPLEVEDYYAPPRLTAGSPTNHPLGK